MKRDLYVMYVNRGKNCYSCERFGYIVRNCKNWSFVGQEKRMEDEDNMNSTNNLKGKKSLVVLN